MLLFYPQEICDGQNCSQKCAKDDRIYHRFQRKVVQQKAQQENGKEKDAHTVETPALLQIL